MTHKSDTSNNTSDSRSTSSSSATSQGDEYVGASFVKSINIEANNGEIAKASLLAVYRRIWLRNTDLKTCSTPLSAEEIEQHSQIRCSLCGKAVNLESIEEHSLGCSMDDKLPNINEKFIGGESISSLELRRKDEISQVATIEAEIRRELSKLWWLSGRFYFLISSEWLTEWRAFAGISVSRDHFQEEPVLVSPPGPIDNEKLFEEKGGKLRLGLKEGLRDGDYHVIEPPMWEFYKKTYGGGPAVLRFVPSEWHTRLEFGSLRGEFLEASVDCSFEGDWKFLYPYSGRGHVFDPITGLGFDGVIQEGRVYTVSGISRGLLPCGKLFQGAVEEGLPCGPGMLISTDGSLHCGTFKNGKLDGIGSMFYPDGRESSGFFIEGELRGI